MLAKQRAIPARTYHPPRPMVPVHVQVGVLIHDVSGFSLHQVVSNAFDNVVPNESAVFVVSVSGIFSAAMDDNSSNI
jgi:hypothetical protein